MIKEKLCEAKIIKTAFDEWGKTAFRNATLKSISDKLNLTKPALYRYFKNKNEIFEKMFDCFMSDYQNVTNSFINECGNTDDLDFIIKSYINNYFKFFSNNHHYFFFFIFHAVKNDCFIKKSVIDIDEIENKIFTRGIKNTAKIWIKVKDVGLLKRFIFSTGIFLLLFKFGNKKTKFLHSIDDKESDAILNDIYYIIKNGFGLKKIKSNINFKKVESIAGIKKEQLPERDKVIDAIASVIAEEGIWNTTLSKISKKLGIVKSSLYFYFKNKKEMLSSSILNEIKKNDKLIKSKILNNSSYEEKFYSLIVAFSSYLLLDNNMMKIFDWIHQQGVNLKLMKDIENEEQIDTQIIREGISEKYLDNQKFDDIFISNFFKMQIIKEIYISDLFKQEIKISDMRNIYKLFLNGIREVKK